MSASAGFKAELLLCDAAEAVGGKLFILGLGWSQIVDIGQPINIALGVYIKIPWNSTNTKLKLVIELMTEDGRPAMHDGMPIRIEADMEAGRPVGVRPGSDLDSVMAIPLNGLRLERGAYRWELSIDGDVLETTAFAVIAPPPGFPLPPTAR